MSTLRNLDKFYASKKNLNLTTKQEVKIKYDYINSVGKWEKNGDEKTFKLKDEYRHLLPKDTDNSKDKWAEFKTALNSQFTMALKKELAIKELRQSISNLSEESETEEDKQKNFDYLKKIGNWNKEKNNSFEIKNEFRGLAAEELKNSDLENDKFAEFKIAMSRDFRKNLNEYLDQSLAQNQKKIQNSQLLKKQQKDLNVG